MHDIVNTLSRLWTWQWSILPAWCTCWVFIRLLGIYLNWSWCKQTKWRLTKIWTQISFANNWRKLSMSLLS